MHASVGMSVGGRGVLPRHEPRERWRGMRGGRRRDWEAGYDCEAGGEGFAEGVHGGVCGGNGGGHDRRGGDVGILCGILDLIVNIDDNV